MKFAIIGIFVMLVIISFVWVDHFQQQQEGNKIVVCFDEKGNEIIGLECVDEPDGVGEAIFISVFAFIVVVGLCFVENFPK